MPKPEVESGSRSLNISKISGMSSKTTRTSKLEFFWINHVLPVSFRFQFAVSDVGATFRIAYRNHKKILSF